MGQRIFSWYLGHKTKMADVHIYCVNPSNHLIRDQRVIDIVALNVALIIIVCSNADPKLVDLLWHNQIFLLCIYQDQMTGERLQDHCLHGHWSSG